MIEGVADAVRSRHTAGCPIRFDPAAPRQAEEPALFFRAMRETCPVHYEERLDLWIVTRYQDVQTVLRDPATFSSAGAVTSSVSPLPKVVQEVLARAAWPLTLLTESDPPLHRQLRGLVQKAFTPRRVRSLEPVVAERARALIDTFRSRGEREVEIIGAFAWPLPIAVIGRMLGVEPARAEDLHRWSRDLLLLLQGAGDEEALTRRAQSVVAMQRYFEDALASRKDERHDDLMGALLEDWDPAALSLPELVHLLMNLVVAGHLTVTRAIGSALVLLDRLGLLSDEPGLSNQLDAIVEEALRLETPAQGLFRRVTRDTSLDGTPLSAGARVMVHFGAANRDERVFASADEFDAQREGISRHLAFGKGAHFCLGAPLARMELRTALSTLQAQLPGIHVLTDRQARRDPIFFARGYEELHVGWDA